MTVSQRVMVAVVTAVFWISASTTNAGTNQPTNSFQKVDETYFERLEHLDAAIRQVLISLSSREWRIKHSGYSFSSSTQLTELQYAPYDFDAHMERRASEYRHLLEAIEKADLLSRRFPDSEIHKPATNNAVETNVTTNRMRTGSKK